MCTEASASMDPCIVVKITKKVVLVGPAGVGKSMIAHQLTRNQDGERTLSIAE